uniref:Isopenicillin N synthase-like Fe(2+) 2OG dioxygenase domain-containing protein n=1 Tax=Kalanchoe fedtschenkoi TaxID=63787 RepID=A0A7N0TVV0_KALFE
MPTERAEVVVVPETFARDAIIAWFRGEFAAANAIIDALCGHLAQIAGGGGEYASVFTAIHRRRMNWIAILQMQKYHSIADVAIELKKVAASRKVVRDEIEIEIRDVNTKKCLEDEKKEEEEKVTDSGAAVEDEDSPDSEITDGGSQGTHSSVENTEICSNHEDCNSRPTQIKLIKRLIAREPVKGHMVNVVKGLKLFEDIFTDSEICKLSEFVHDLQIAGRSGELPGETFKIFNQQIKGSKRELIQFGEPIFKPIKEDCLMKEQRNNMEQIPPLLQNVIEHLVQWRLVPNRMPNSCIINFFDEGEYSQPYLKPPHVDQPITTLVLSDSTMAFGCTLVSDNEGNYKAPQMLSLKKGSLLVMRGNSADVAAHAMCPSPTKRAAITFFRVRCETNQNHSMMISPLDGAMTVWQPGMSSPHPILHGHGYSTLDIMPSCGVLYAPMPILPPARPMALNHPRRQPRGGTGVFLPSNGNPRKHTKHLPPRVQNGRLLALRPENETHKTATTPNTTSGTPVEEKTA